MTISHKTQPAESLHGTIRVASDKSISHRSLIFSALADGQSRVKHLLLGEDVLCTLTMLNQLGVKTSHSAKTLTAADELVLEGVGVHGLKESNELLYCGNSGTTMRLMLGLLSGQSFVSRLTGDEYLNKRPMERVMKPLTQMGAQFSVTQEGDQRIITVQPSKKLQGISYASPVASAQVKSCLILAGLYADGITSVSEPSLSRNHTEIMLQAQGAPLAIKDLTVSVTKTQNLKPLNITVPADISSAAFFIVAALITPNSDLLIQDVCLNPTRTGLLDILKAMGAHIEIIDERFVGGEVVGDLRVKTSKLKNVAVGGAVIPRLIDEIPVLTLAAALAEGQMVLTDAGELRVKETDRIKAICSEMTKLGVAIQETKDGFILTGRAKLEQPSVDFKSYGDHRMAMTEMIAGLVLDQSVMIDDVACVQTSFPEFFELLGKIRN